jgi:hypothetical protein
MPLRERGCGCNEDCHQRHHCDLIDQRDHRIETRLWKRALGVTQPGRGLHDPREHAEQDRGGHQRQECVGKIEKVLVHGLT